MKRSTLLVVPMIACFMSISALLATGVLLPAFSYAGQLGPGSPARSAASTEVAPARLLLTAHHFGGGGGWHGGHVWHGGHFHRHFYGGYGGTYVEPYYVTPSCDTVWDPYLEEWGCADHYDAY